MMQSSHDDPGCDCVGYHDKKIFYPKKISPATPNMLTMSGFCEHSFSLWWKDTNISQDFWVETSSSLLRVHVVPRRTMFNPMAWSTQNSDHKSVLIANLGLVRSTWGIACGTHRGFHLCMDPGSKMITGHIRSFGLASLFSQEDLWCLAPL